LKFYKSSQLSDAISEVFHANLLFDSKHLLQLKKEASSLEGEVRDGAAAVALADVGVGRSSDLGANRV